jgi:hypothetical protein
VLLSQLILKVFNSLLILLHLLLEQFCLLPKLLHLLLILLRVLLTFLRLLKDLILIKILTSSALLIQRCRGACTDNSFTLNLCSRRSSCERSQRPCVFWVEGTHESHERCLSCEAFEEHARQSVRSGLRLLVLGELGKGLAHLTVSEVDTTSLLGLRPVTIGIGVGLKFTACAISEYDLLVCRPHTQDKMASARSLVQVCGTCRPLSEHGVDSVTDIICMGNGKASSSPPLRSDTERLRFGREGIAHNTLPGCAGDMERLQCNLAVLTAEQKLGESALQ